MLFCFEVSCRRRLPPSTNSNAYQRLVTSGYGPSQLSVLHLALERFTARGKAKYWLRIAISAYSICIRRVRYGGSRRNIAMTFGMENLKWCGGEKN